MVRPPEESPPLLELLSWLCALVETDEAALVSIKVMPEACGFDPDPLYYLFVDVVMVGDLTFWAFIFQYDCIFMR